MSTRSLVFALLGAWLSVFAPEVRAVEVYGAWHCGNDYCTWSTARDVTEFDAKNHWLIDRGDGRFPAVAINSGSHPLHGWLPTNR